MPREPSDPDALSAEQKVLYLDIEKDIHERFKAFKTERGDDALTGPWNPPAFMGEGRPEGHDAGGSR